MKSSILRASTSLLVVWLGLASASALAGTINVQWIGPTGGGGNGNWSTAADWSGGVVPNNEGGNSYSVTLPFYYEGYRVSFDMNATIDSLTLQAGIALSGNSHTLTTGSLTNAGTLVWTGGILNVSGTFANGGFLSAEPGGVFNINALSNHGGVAVFGTATLNLTGGGQGVTDLTGTWYVAGAVNVINHGIVTNAFANLTTVDGQLFLGDGRTTTVAPQGGTLTVGPTGAVDVGNSRLSGGFGSGFGGTTLTVNGSVNNYGYNNGEGGFRVDATSIANVTGTFTNEASGLLKIGGVLNLGAFTNRGLVDIFPLNGGSRGGTLNVASGHVSSSGTIQLSSTDLTVADLSNTGVVETLAPSTINISGTLTNGVGGKLDLNNAGDRAEIGTLANHGNVSVHSGALLGVGAGTFTGGSGYEQLGDGTLVEMISRPWSPSAFGVINVLGPASLDGTLDILLEGGYIPYLGEAFAFLDFTPGELSGTFADINGLSFDDGKGEFGISYDQARGEVILTVVKGPPAPEPASLLLVGTGLLTLAYRFRCKLSKKPSQ